MADTLHLKVVLEALDKATGPINDILRGSKSLQRAFMANAEAFKKLKVEQRDINGYRQQETALSRTSNALAQQRNELKAMKAALDATEQPTAKLTKAFDRQLRAVKALAEKQREQRAGLAESRAKLAAAGVETSKLAQHETRLAREIGRANDQLKTQQARLRQVGEAQAAAGRLRRGGMLAAAHGAGAWALRDQAAAPGRTMLEAFSEQETAATGLRVAMMGANGQISSAYSQISAMAIDLGNRLPGTSADLLNMMTMLKRQGMSDQVILGGLGRTAAYLGAVLKMPYVDAAEFAAKLQDATRTSEADMLQLGDTIQRAFYLGVDSDNMLQGFVKLSPAMDILRIHGIEATRVFAPMLVMMDQMGMKGEQAGNALRKVFQGAMGGGVEKANEQLRAMGSRIRFDFTDGHGEFGGMDKMFAQLEQLKRLNTVDRLAVLKTIFGDDSETLSTISALMNKGRAGYLEIQRRMQAQADLQTRVNASLGTLSALWEAATGTFRNALAAFGEAAAPQIKELTSWLGTLSEKIMAWAKANPKAAGGLVKLSLGAGALLAAAGAVLVPLGIMAGMIGHIITLFTTLGGGALLGGGTGLAASLSTLFPPLLLIAGIGVLIYRYWKQLKAFFGGFWDGFLDGIQPVSLVLSDLIDTLASIFSPVDASSESLQKLANIGQLFGEIFGGVVTFTVVVLAGFIKMLAIAFWGVGTLIGNIIGFVVTEVGYLWDLMTGVFSGDWSQVQAALVGLWNNANQFLGGIPAKLQQIGINMVMGLVNGIKSMYGAAKDAIGGLGHSIIEFFTGPKQMDIHSPSRTFARFGMFTMAGFTQGLLGGEGGAQAALGRIGAGLRRTGAGIAIGSTLAAGAASAASAASIDHRPPLATGSRGGAGMSATYNITINAAQGQNAQDIAALVRQEIERIEHARRVRTRSELSDYD